MSSTGGATYKLGAPTAAVVPAGTCQLDDDDKWISVPLMGRVRISPDTSVLSFGLPDKTKPLNLPTCACILARGGEDNEGKPVVRPYTPISTNVCAGKMDLIIKVYDKGVMTQHMDKMKVGDSLEFKHIKFNVKMQYPFNKSRIGMLVGGTGITPMIQALHAVLGTPSDKSEVSMLYGSRTVADILAREVLDDWNTTHKDQFTVTHVLSNEPADTPYDGPRGFITKELIEKHLPAPADDTLIFVCGPPPMYKALCGPREEKDVTGILGEMGYSAEQVYKF